MKYIKLFEERLRDYEILSSTDSDLLISELRKEIGNKDYDIEYIIDLVTYGHFNIDVFWFDERNEQWSFLKKASHLNKEDIIKALLDGGADPNLQGELGRTALMSAAREGNSQAVQELLKHPDTDPNLQNYAGATALMGAAVNGRTQAVQELLKHPDIDPNLQNKDGWTALMGAAECGYSQAVQELLSHPDIDPNLQDELGWTALMLAANFGKTQAVQELLKHPDIDIEMKNHKNNDFLSIALKSDNTEILSEFLKKYNDRVDDELLMAIIMYCINNDSGNIVSDLTDEYDINISRILNHVDKNGDSILMMAIKKGSVNFIEAFLENHGIDINYQYKNNSTALIMAVEHKRSDIVGLLLKYPSIDPNIERWGGMSALLIATINNDIESVRLLLNKYNTDINSENNNGYTALHYSMSIGKNGYKNDIIELLLSEPSIDKSHTNINNETAWDLAKPQIREQFPQLNPNRQ